MSEKDVWTRIPVEVIDTGILPFLRSRECARLRLCSRRWKIMMETEMSTYWKEEIVRLCQQHPSLLRRQRNAYLYSLEHHHCDLSLSQCMNRETFCSSLYSALGTYEQSPHPGDWYGWGYVYDTLAYVEQATGSQQMIQPPLRTLFQHLSELPCRNYRHYTPVRSRMYVPRLPSHTVDSSFETWKHLYRKAFTIRSKAQRQRYHRQYRSHPDMSETWGLWRRHL